MIVAKEDKRIPRAAAYAAFPLLALVLLRGVLSGGPFYNHDWNWPLAGAQLRDAVFTNSSAWTPSALGGPAISPLLHPVFLIWTALAYLFAPSVVAGLTLVAALTLIGTGIAYSARALGVRYDIAVIAGLLSEMGPAIVNKLAAGHLYYLISLGAIAWSIGLAIDTGSRRNARFILAGACIGLAILQVQLYIVAMCGLAVCLVSRRDLSIGVRAASLLGAIALAFPIPAALSASGVVASTLPLKTTPEWIANNSAPLWDGIVQLGYSSGYAYHALFAVMVPFAKAGLWACILLAAVALIRHRRSRAVVVVGVAWILATLFVLGSHGPLAGLLPHIAAGSSFFSIFRELYDFAGIAWICEVLLAATTLSDVPFRAAITCACAIGVLYSAFWWTPDVGGALITYPYPQAAIAALERIERDPGDWRFFLLPAEWPVAPIGAKRGGSDPLEYQIGSHPAANDYRLSGPLELAAGFARSGADAKARAWFGVSGIGAIVREPGLAMFESGRFPPPHAMPAALARRIRAIATSLRAPSVEPACVFCSYGSLPVVHDLYEFNGADAFLGDRLMRSDCSVSSEASRAADPSKEWIPIADWQWLDPRFAALSPAAMMTWSSSELTVTCTRPALVRAATLNGTLRIDGHAAHLAGDYATLLLRSGSHRVSAGGPAAIDALVAVSPLRNSGGFSRSASSLDYDWKTASGSGTVAKNTRWIVLKTRFSRDWTLTLHGGRVLEHREVSGYANGWQVALDADTPVSVTYRPELPVHLLQLAGLIVWCAIVAAIAAERVFARNRLAAQGCRSLS